MAVLVGNMILNPVVPNPHDHTWPYMTIHDHVIMARSSHHAVGKHLVFGFRMCHVCGKHLPVHPEISVRSKWKHHGFSKNLSGSKWVSLKIGLPAIRMDYRITIVFPIEKKAFFFLNGYPIYFQTNPNSTNSWNCCGNRPNLWVPAFE